MFGIKKLNFGCGDQAITGWVNADIMKARGVDVVFDFNEFPYPFKENTFDEIFIDNVLEHLFRLPKVVHELYRIAKDGCVVKIIVPYYSCSDAYNDPTHIYYFNKVALKQLFDSKSPYNRGKKIRFEFKKIHLAPSLFGKFLPNKMREFVSFYIGNVIRMIEVEVVVKKDG